MERFISSTPHAARARAGRGGGKDHGRHCRHRADRFPRRHDREARALSPAGAGDTNKVRYVGDPIAAVFAEERLRGRGRRRPGHGPNRGIAGAAACRPHEPGEFSPGRNTEAAVLTQGYGDADAVFRTAPAHSSSLKLTSGRHSGVPIECRGALGRYDASRDMLELHGAAKVPHRNKELIARMLGRTAVVGEPASTPMSVAASASAARI